MFGSLERNLETFRIEAFLPDYLVRAQLKPLGDLPNYLNDRRREFIRLDEAEVVPLVGDRHLRPIHRETLALSKRNLLLLTIVEPGDAVKTQILVAKRPAVIYLGQIIVRGQLHVNPEASDLDMLDEARDYYPVTEANIFHLQSTTPAYAREVPLLFVNRPLVQGYHPHVP